MDKTTDKQMQLPTNPQEFVKFMISYNVTDFYEFVEEEDNISFNDMDYWFINNWDWLRKNGFYLIKSSSSRYCTIDIMLNNQSAYFFKSDELIWDDFFQGTRDEDYRNE